MTNLSAELVATAERNPSRVALRCGDRTRRYAEFLESARKVAASLRARGIGAGERVGLAIGNELDYPVAFYGALLAGCVVVPMNPLLTTRETEYYLTDSGASGVVVGAQRTAAEVANRLGIPVLTAGEVGTAQCEEPVARADTDTAVILYTSGTTGTPKGAELTHANLRSNAGTSARMFGLDPDDVVMGALPLFHVFGLTCGLNAAVVSGACLTLLPRFAGDTALSVLERAGVTVFIGVPTMYAAMLQAPGRFDVSALRLCASGGSAMPAGVLRRFEKAFGCVILEGYGLSETSPVAAFNHRDAPRKPGSIGTPVEGMRLRLVGVDGQDVTGDEVGEIAIRGEGVMKGYWRRPDATREAIPDGWFRTGDLARRDAEGYYFIVDRKKDLIIRGGYNVYPREVEDALYAHPAVVQVAVIGLPHPELGEEVGAAVVVRPGEPVTVDELREFARTRLAPYKYPRRIWLCDELPLGPTGKILRRAVRPPAEGPDQLKSETAGPSGSIPANGSRR